MRPESSPRHGHRFLEPLQQWEGALPLLMSAIVLVMVLVQWLRHGAHAPHHDEGTADHLAIALMYGQVPIMLWFVATRRHPVRTILPVLVAQLGLWVVTFIAAALLA